MTITWKDGVTTLAAASAVLLERAYFHTWDLPLVMSVRWVLLGLAVLAAITYTLGFLLDREPGDMWGASALSVIIVLGALTLLGMINPASDYLVLLMLGNVLLGIGALVRHLFAAPSGMRPRHV